LSRCELKNHVFLHDQEMNQLGALWGSETGLMDTLDLSSASDSVGWDLVRKIFPAKVLKHLAATRSHIVELPNGTWTNVHKYAPMGSALCFPVQSTIYAAISIMCGIAWAYGRDWRQSGCFDGLDMREAYNSTFNHTHFSAETRRLQPVLVYGDDIICDKRVTSNTIECLKLLRFEVNEAKSFYGSEAYRESCGMHFVAGEDVTPFVLKTGAISENGVEPVVLGGLIDQANRAYSYKFEQLRRHLIQFVLYTPILGFNAERRPRGRNPILFTSNRDDTFALRTDNPRNEHLRVRRYIIGEEPRLPLIHLVAIPNESVDPEKKSKKKIRRHFRNDTHILYQRDEWASVSLRPCDLVKYTEHVDEMRYLAWWHSRYSGGGTTDQFVAPAAADALGTRMAWRWTARP